MVYDFETSGLWVNQRLRVWSCGLMVWGLGVRMRALSR